MGGGGERLGSAPAPPQTRALQNDGAGCRQASVPGSQCGLRGLRCSAGVARPPPHHEMPLLCASAMPSLGHWKTGTFSHPILLKNAPIVSIPSKGKKLHVVPDELVLLISCCVRTGGQGGASGVGEQRPIYFGKTPPPCTIHILHMWFKFLPNCPFPSVQVYLSQRDNLASESLLVTVSRQQMANP